MLSLLTALPVSMGAVQGAASEDASGESATTVHDQAVAPIQAGRPEEAEARLLELVAGDPNHAGAWLDLALLQCSRGNAQEAEALFKLIERRFAPPAPIQTIIAHHRAGGCLPPARTHLRLRLGRGWDDNANQGASSSTFSVSQGGSLIELVLAPEYRPASDGFTHFAADVVRVAPRDGITGYVQLSGRKYDSLSRFDLTTLTGGAEYTGNLDWGVWRAGGGLGVTMLGGTRYQQQVQTQFQLVPTLPLGPTWEVSGTAGWTHVEYPSLTNFDADIWEARGQLTWHGADTLLQFSAGYAYDLSEDRRPGGDRSGPFANGLARTRLYGKAIGELGLTWQAWDGADAYAPGFVDYRRDQRTMAMRAAVILPLNDKHALHLEIRHVQSDENISLFEYDSNVVQISWQWNGVL